MPRKPNYDFERREREKAKAAKTAERLKAKSEKAATQAAPEQAGEKSIPIDKLDSTNDE